MLNSLETLLQPEDIACFIFEPLVLGAGGMQMYAPEHLQQLIELCKKYNCITIADEVMTGFGRTGKFFATDYLSQRPDILCMSKGITGGFFPLGATACKQFIFNAYISHDKMKTFFHGHSYTGNPVTCAAALASMDLMESPETLQQLQLISDCHTAFAKELQQFTTIKYQADRHHSGV